MKQYVTYFIAPVAYSVAMLIKTPNISDALIVLALAGMGCFFGHISNKNVDYKKDTELQKLEEEVQRERLKMSLDQLRETSIREKAVRDARAAVEGFGGNKEIRF